MRSESRTRSERPGQAYIGERSGDELVTVLMGRRRSEVDYTRLRSSKSGKASTRSCEYGRPARRAMNKQRSAALTSLYRRPGSGWSSACRHRRSEEENDHVVGKWMSELPPADYWSGKSRRAPNMRRQLSRYQSRRCSVESDLSYDSGYDTDGILKDRPVRVCMYPQLKYCKVPGKMPAESHQRNSVASVDNTLSSASSSNTSSFRKPENNTYRPGGLPHDEYRIIVRRQQMQRVREALEPHFAQYGNQQRPRVWHGLKQGFKIRKTERRRISRIQYAVRKALKANFDLLSDAYELARYRHAAKIHYCDLSDVDGVPLPEELINDFTRAFQDAEDAAYEPKFPAFPYGEPVQRTWIDERIRRAAAARRVDSGIVIDAPVKWPQPVSKFSWDSDSDEEAGKRNWLTKVKRSNKQPNKNAKSQE